MARRGPCGIQGTGLLHQWPDPVEGGRGYHTCKHRVLGQAGKAPLPGWHKSLRRHAGLMRMELKIGRQSVMVKENLIDKVVSYFDPVKGQQRFQARAMAAIAGGYIGASRSRRALSQWT